MRESSSFWDKRSEKYDESIQDHDDVYNDRIKKITSVLKKTDIILDFACASGEISLDIAPHVKHVHGIDLSGKMILLAGEKANKRQIKNVEFTHMDAFDKRLTSGSFSAIIACNVIHLLDDAPKVLDRLHDLLTPGGLLISETPCLGERNWIVRGLITIASKVGFLPMILNLTFADLESLISNRNFKILESRIWDKHNTSQWIVAEKVD